MREEIQRCPTTRNRVAPGPPEGGRINVSPGVPITLHAQRRTETVRLPVGGGRLRPKCALDRPYCETNPICRSCTGAHFAGVPVAPIARPGRAVAPASLPPHRVARPSRPGTGAGRRRAIAALATARRPGYPFWERRGRTPFRLPRAPITRFGYLAPHVATCDSSKKVFLTKQSPQLWQRDAVWARSPPGGSGGMAATTPLETASDKTTWKDGRPRPVHLDGRWREALAACLKAEEIVSHRNAGRLSSGPVMCCPTGLPLEARYAQAGPAGLAGVAGSAWATPRCAARQTERNTRSR